MVRSDANGTVLNAGLLNDVDNFLGYVVEGRNPTARLKLDFLLKNCELHNKILQNMYLF